MLCGVEVGSIQLVLRQKVKVTPGRIKKRRKE
jgi:hypothetical protein